MKRIELSPPQLLAAINWLHRASQLNVQIDIPWCQKPIIEVDFAESTATAKLSMKTSQTDFSEAASREGIDQHTLECSLFSSGIVKPMGWDDLIHEVEEARGRNLLKGDTPRRVAFDTVALNRRYYTVLERHFSAGSQDPSGGWGVGYLITSGILKELAKYDRKYRSTELLQFAEEFQTDWFDYDTFTNQLTTRDRLFRIGDVESKKLCNSGRCIRASSKTGDDEIIGALANHSRYNREDVVAVSEDSDFVSKCKSYEVKALRLDRFRISSEPVTTRWLEVCDLMYVLAVSLGALRFRWSGKSWMTVEGIWKGKKEESWNEEHVRVASTDKELEKWLDDFRAVTI